MKAFVAVLASLAVSAKADADAQILAHPGLAYNYGGLGWAGYNWGHGLTYAAPGSVAVAAAPAATVAAAPVAHAAYTVAAPALAYGHIAVNPYDYAGQIYPAEEYVHEEIAAEPYVHEEIAAEPYVHEEIAAEPYVHIEPVHVEPVVAPAPVAVAA